MRSKSGILTIINMLSSIIGTFIKCENLKLLHQSFSNVFRMKLILFIAVFCPFLLNADPIAKPGHLMIKYYQKQAAEKNRLSSRHLRIQCESQISRGYVSDRRW